MRTFFATLLNASSGLVTAATWKVVFPDRVSNLFVPSSDRTVPLATRYLAPLGPLLRDTHAKHFDGRTLTAALESTVTAMVFVLARCDALRSCLRCRRGSTGKDRKGRQEHTSRARQDEQKNKKQNCIAYWGRALFKHTWVPEKRLVAWVQRQPTHEKKTQEQPLGAEERWLTTT